MMFTMPCHTPLSLSVTISLIRIETTVVMPPPPTPANIYESLSETPLNIHRYSHPCSYQLAHISGQTTKEASKAKYCIREEECRFPPKYITELSVQWLERSEGKEVAR